jgi:hypothetical protein
MVNTFVVSSCVKECAKHLDYKRLGKQRVEARQLVNALEGKYKKGWVNHPATLAWVGHINALNHYTNVMIDEWVARGYNNTMEKLPVTQPVEWPWWFTWDVLQNSHKASLNRKDPSYYSFKIPPEFANRGYVWPTKVPEEYRGVDHPPLDVVCAPVQAPASYSKKKKKQQEKGKGQDAAALKPVTKAGKAKARVKKEKGEGSEATPAPTAAVDKAAPEPVTKAGLNRRTREPSPNRDPAVVVAVEAKKAPQVGKKRKVETNPAAAAPTTRRLRSASAKS